MASSRLLLPTRAPRAVRSPEGLTLDISTVWGVRRYREYSPNACIASKHPMVKQVLSLCGWRDDCGGIGTIS